MLAILAGRLAKKITSAQRGDEALMIIGYLARHSGWNADRRARLAGLLRERWSRVPDVEMVAGRYPGVGPDGPPPAEIDFRTRWVVRGAHFPPNRAGAILESHE